MKMTRAMPMPFQTSTKATDSRAMFGLDSHCGPSIPTTSSDRLIRPVDGCISTANVMPTATVLTRTGKKMADRSTLRLRRREVSSVARSSPMTTLRPLVTTA